MPNETTLCGWPDCCGGDPRACWQTGQEKQREWWESFMRNQQPLGPEFEKVLHDNLWSLYVRS